MKGKIIQKTYYDDMGKIIGYTYYIKVMKKFLGFSYWRYITESTYVSSNSKRCFNTYVEAKDFFYNIICKNRPYNTGIPTQTVEVNCNED